MEAQRRRISEWLDFLVQADIPVFARTARDLQWLHGQEQALDPRHLAAVITDDPLMTVKLLRFLQRRKHAHWSYELIDVKQMLLMIGIETFFREVPAAPLVDEALQETPEALDYLERTALRARRAAYYAYDWALRLRQPHPEEAQIAALLAHVTEMLMWCFNSGPMLEIRRRMAASPTRRSAEVQIEVLGFSGRELQRELAVAWQLPELLVNLLDPAHAQADRVRHVMLAANLARHSEHGWNDPALPHDYREIAQLLHTEPRKVMDLVHGKAIPERP